MATIAQSSSTVPCGNALDTVVWLDLPRRTVMRQVTLRTLRRIVHRDELWNGNRERIRTLWAWDPHKSIIRWAWTQHAKYQQRFSSAMASSTLTHIHFVRLTSRHQAEQWLSSLRATPRQQGTP